MKRFLTLIVLACVSVIGVGAQDSVLVAVPRLRLDFPLIDANHWKNAVIGPSCAQTAMDTAAQYISSERSGGILNQLYVIR